ncbi:MAG: hypothetical protein P4N24_06870, partial [Acidobacteriota bacterium]|nr:hypothetical protein [Acidobacteriota bacterium]
LRPRRTALRRSRLALRNTPASHHDRPEPFTFVSRTLHPVRQPNALTVAVDGGQEYLLGRRKVENGYSKLKLFQSKSRPVHYPAERTAKEFVSEPNTSALPVLGAVE